MASSTHISTGAESPVIAFKDPFQKPQCHFYIPNAPSNIIFATKPTEKEESEKG